MNRRDIFRDEEGFTTVGMVVALLVTLALIFSAARVYRVSSVSADIQDIADASVLAAENEVAEFMIAVRVCDAIVLSLSLTGVAAYGLGVAALCIPATAPFSVKLFEAGGKIIKMRNTFADKAAAGLNAFQKTLPFLAAANAASVALSNKGSASDAEYLALAFLVSGTGQEISVDSIAGMDDFVKSVEDEADNIKTAAEEAEELANKASEAKERGFKHDCGDDPSYCMYERALSLSSLTGADNPLYQSVDTWSFAVPLQRARSYYACRLAEEAPLNSSIEEQARSALRTVFYQYALKEVQKGYVNETEDSFDAYFPLLPKNTAEMRKTSLYTDVLYPITADTSGALVMHAWSGCPNAQGAQEKGSIATMEQGDYAVCAICEFSAASMGKVAAASTSIENGFEYHYVEVARAAEDYKQARAQFESQAKAVKEPAQGLIDQCLQLLKDIAGKRIDACPPGSLGAVALVVNTGPLPASAGFESSFVQDGPVLGARAAVSAATLLEDGSEEGKSVISSLLDNFAGDGVGAVGVSRVLLDCWSSFLLAYADGQSALEEGIAQAVDAIPFASASGLGTWAAKIFSSCVKQVGLQPAKLDALKPVLVNSVHVARADTGTFAVRFLEVKQQVLSMPNFSTDLFSSVITSLEKGALEEFLAGGGTIEIALIELPFMENSIPLSITLPPFVSEASEGLIEGFFQGIRGIYGEITGVRVWE